MITAKKKTSDNIWRPTNQNFDSKSYFTFKNED